MTPEELENLRQEVHFLRSRLEKLEDRLSGEARKSSPIPPSIQVPPRIAPQTEVSSRPSNDRHGMSQFMGIVASLCFVLAASFLIKLAVDSGWLTPERQLGMAVLFGFALVGVGFRMHLRDLSYSSLLSGTGIVILHMSAYAGRLYYGLYSPWTAIFLAGGVSIFSLILFRRFREDFFVAIAVVGSYLSILLIPATERSGFDVMAFFLVWDMGFAILATWLESRSVLLLASYLALGLFSLNASGISYDENPQDFLATALFQALQFFIFMMGVARYSIRHRVSMTAGEIGSYFPLLLFFYGIEYRLVSKIQPTLAPWFALGFAGAIYGVYHFVRSQLSALQLQSLSFVSALISIIVFHAFYLEILPNGATPWFAILLLTLTPWITRRVDIKKHWIAAIAWLVVLALNYFKALIAYGSDNLPLEWIAFNLLFFALLFVGYLFQRSQKPQESDWLLFLLLADTQALVGLSRVAEQLSQTFHFEPFERFLVSILWGGLALGVLLLGKSRMDRTLARSSLFIFGIAAGKILLFDVASAGPVTRIFCLVTLGAALYAGGYLYRHIERWKT